jgi:drug/metabolite transporter (DMT)-like permease
VEVLAAAAVFGVVPFFVASFTGGLAGAIQGRGREDRSLLANAGIGFVGWLVAWVLVIVFNGETPDQLSIGMGILALLCSILFIAVLERSRRGRPHEGERPADVG